MIEFIRDGNEEIAIIVYSGSLEKSQFITKDDSSLQLGFLVYREGNGAAAHKHPNIPRTISIPQEFIYVKEGKVKLDLYNSAGGLCSSRVLNAKDSVLFTSGGRGWTALERSEIIEVKQGPFLGEKDKVLM